MKTYWDLTEKERSELSEFGVEAFLAAELMTKGVLKVSVPTYDPEPEADLPSGRKLYRPRVATKEHYGSKLDLNVAFETEEQLRTFLGLAPFIIDHRYFEGSYYDIAIPFTHGDGNELGLVEVRSQEQLESSRGQLEKLAAVRKSNAAKRTAYDNESKAQKEALDGLWQDWYRCRRLADEMQRVAKTFAAYVTTADGDANTAVRFLLKVFSAELICEASDWCGFAIPSDFVRNGDRLDSAPQAAEPAPIETPY